MIFAFVEDGTLQILEDQAEARREFEGIDLETGAYELVSNPNAQQGSFTLALYETAVLQPNRRFAKAWSPEPGA